MERNTSPTLPDTQAQTMYELVQCALDTEIFYDEARAIQAQNGNLNSGDFGERVAVALEVIRSIASARWHNRKALGKKEAYALAPTDERNALAFPQFGQMDDIQSSLAPQRHRIQYINALEHHIEDTHTSGQASGLREHQHDVFDALATFLNRAGKPTESTELASTKAGYIKMPTGTGKTVVAVRFVQALDYPKTYFLTSRKDILRQIVGSDGVRGFSQFAPEAHVTSYYQDEKDLSGNIVVTTYASFNNLVASGEITQRDFDLLICDEVHRALGPATSKNIETVGEGKIVIGLTATDEYAENKKVSQLLPEQIYELGLRESIDNGWLSPVQAWLYKTDVQIDQDARKEFSSAELHRLADVEGRNLKGVEFAKNFVEQGMQGLVSCIPGENVRHAEDIAEMLRKTDVVNKETGEIRKIRAQELRGDMPEEVRQEIYADFENGKIDVLTFVDMLVEGWDSERAKFLVNLRPTCSPVFGVQRLGRILRTTGKGVPAQVIEFLDVTQKAQFTVLHALGEYRYKAGKAYGPTRSFETGAYKLINLPGYLRKHIEGVNMRKVSEIIAGRPYEADFSEMVSVADLAAKLNLCEAAIIHITNENELTIRNAEGGLGASTAQISEVDRDKVIALVKEGRYEWLKGQTQAAILQYMEAREARLRAAVKATAEVVASQSEGLRRIAEEEAKDAAAAQQKAAELAAAERQERLKQYETTELDKLLKHLAASKINLEDFKDIIYTQAASGTIKPMAIVRLGLSGQQPGEWGEVQVKLVEGVMQYPALAMAAVNIAKQLGTITDIQNEIKNRFGEVHCYATISLRDKPSFTVEAGAKNGKTAQQVAAVYAIAHLAGVDMANIPNPHARPKPQKPDYTIIHQVELPEDVTNPKGRLIEIFQKNKSSKPPKFWRNATIQNGDTLTYYSTVIFDIAGKRYKMNGSGDSDKAAQADAALRALVVYRDELKKVGAPDPHKIARIDRLADTMNPTKFLLHRSTQLKIKAPKFAHVETPEGIVQTVTIPDNHGQMQTFYGHPVQANETMDKKEVRELNKSSRLVACQLAINAVRLSS